MSNCDKMVFDAAKEITIAKLSNSVPSSVDEHSANSACDFFAVVYSRLKELADDAD